MLRPDLRQAAVTVRLFRPTGPPRRNTAAKTGPRTPTTEPGYANPNRQVVERATGMASAERHGQRVYVLRCRDCGLLYGCSGLDIKERCCPGCQGGVAGEPLPISQPTLFPK